MTMGPSPVLRMALYLSFPADCRGYLMNKESKATVPLSTPTRISEFHIAQVRCDGFRCMAYRDPKGNWRNYVSGEPLEVIEVLSE